MQRVFPLLLLHTLQTPCVAMLGMRDYTVWVAPMGYEQY